MGAVEKSVVETFVDEQKDWWDEISEVQQKLLINLW